MSRNVQLTCHTYGGSEFGSLNEVYQNKVNSYPHYFPTHYMSCAHLLKSRSIVTGIGRTTVQEHHILTERLGRKPELSPPSESKITQSGNALQEVVACNQWQASPEGPPRRSTTPLRIPPAADKKEKLCVCAYAERDGGISSVILLLHIRI